MPEGSLNKGYVVNSTAGGPVVVDLNAKSLDSLLGDSIDQVLGDLLGRKAREAIYDYIERNYSVGREDIPKNIDKLFTLMEDLFGKGRKTVERTIAKRLWQQLGWTFKEMPGFEFSDYLEAARARICREVLEKARANLLNGR